MLYFVTSNSLKQLHKMKAKKLTPAQIQIIKASLLGTMAFKNGKMRVPMQDIELMNMLQGRKIGETQKGEASNIQIMKSWISAWDNANLANSYMQSN